MTRQLTRPQAIQLGAVVTLGLTLAGWLLTTLDERRGLGSDSLVVETGFTDIAGVEVGTRVRLQGIDAGEVVAVIPPHEPGANVKLRIRLAAKIRHLVTADARVQIASDSLFTGRIVRILPGSLSSGLAAEGACLASAPSVEINDVLAKVNAAMDDIDQGKGTLGKLIKDDSLYTNLAQTAAKANSILAKVNSITDESLFTNLAQSAAKANSILTKVNSTMDDVSKGKGTIGKLFQDETLYYDLTSTLAEVKLALYEVRQGDGTLGKLVKNNDAYSEAMQSLHDMRRMVASVKQNADAIKSLPVVRSYVIDAHKELVRPDCQRYCKWFAETDLFEPGRAVLTTAGKKQLDDAAPWLNGHKEVGAELVVASFAKLGQDSDVAQTLTQKQSEAVCEYLKASHQIHRTGWWWWSTRSVRAIGAGTNHPAIPGSEKLPQARIELLVFVPGS